jgi:hypothetical protein
MSCCISLDRVPDWYDWEAAQPQEITELVALAQLGGGIYPIIAGTKARVTDFASQTWAASQLTILSQPHCSANGSDKGANTSNAEQWMFDHKTWNDSATLPESLKKVMFMRAGTQWRMDVHFTVTGPANIAEVYLAFRDNGGTRGDNASTYPVIKWSAAGPGYSGDLTLQVDLKQIGRYNVVLWTKSKPTGTPLAPVYSMTEMEWIIVY